MRASRLQIQTTFMYVKFLYVTLSKNLILLATIVLLFQIIRICKQDKI